MSIKVIKMAFWLIETDSQIEYLINKKYEEVFVEVISYNDNLHPILNDVSLIYYKPLKSNKGFMLCIDHSESLNADKTLIDTLLTQTSRIWVRDKKKTLYYLPIKNLYDVNLIDTPYEPALTPTHIYFQNKYPEYKEINKLIPISKHYELCEDIYNNVKHNFDKELPSYFEFYNNKATLAFFGIEKNGITINENIFYEHFKPNQPFYSIQDSKIYTNYNLYTTTRRPSNAFNGINFAALNKENGSRKSFIPQNHRFVEIDISAYHPHLAANLVGYDFGDQDVHQVFADMYGVSYDESKNLTFKQLYGGVFREYENLEYFQLIKQYINNIWKEFNNSGKVITPISGYCFEKSKLDNMNPQKLFNYFLQNIESSNNVHILMDIHKLLKGKNTKLVLYTYDSVLIDYDDEEKLFNSIKNIFKKYNLKIKVKNGTNYDF
jgi:hypothetical protein